MLDRTFCFSSSFIHSFEHRVELTVEKKKGIVIPYGAYLVPLIFNSIETL